ncbi:MAG: DUF998 domain-containing protein [Thermoplasmata archaeon]
MAVHSPPVHRSVRTGGILLIVAALQFLVVTIVSAQYYSNFSWATTHITSLGEPASPENLLFNTSLVVFGLLAFGGFLLAWTAFPPGTARVGGLSLLLLSSLATIGVGLTPGVSNNVHVAVAQLIFLPAALGFLLLGWSMTSSTAWGSFRWFSVVLGILIVIAFAILFYTNYGGSQYPGAFGLLAIGPILLWEVVVGGYLASLKIRAPRHLIPGV